MKTLHGKLQKKNKKKHGKKVQVGNDQEKAQSEASPKRFQWDIHVTDMLS